MKKMYYKTAWVILATVFMISCQPPTTNEKQNATNSSEVRFVRDKVITQFEQEKLTPDLVIQSLKDGNQRFVKNELTATNNTAMVRDAAAGQYPEAIVLSCIAAGFRWSMCLTKASAICLLAELPETL
jgi:carbonic anhydrase